MSIHIKKLKGDYFEVVVLKDQLTTHIVRISDEAHSKFTNNRLTKEQFLKKSFLFLLQRESNTEILSEFNIEIILEYFPEFAKIGSLGWIDVSV